RRRGQRPGGGRVSRHHRRPPRRRQRRGRPAGQSRDRDRGASVSTVNWDGKVQSYRPASDWREHVSPAVRFHDEAAEDLDPVTYEVIRHRLWTINMAHGETITRISGSPVFATLDFNMSILSEDAEI